MAWAELGVEPGVEPEVEPLGHEGGAKVGGAPRGGSERHDLDQVLGTRM